MEPCRSVSARVPPFRSPCSSVAKQGSSSSSRSGSGRLQVTAPRHDPHHHHHHHYSASEDTLKHLIHIIEQLKSKDKVISQLERELGHPAAVAGPVSMATEVTRTSSSGQHSNKMETPPLSPQNIYSGLSQVFQRLHGTSMASFPLGGEEKGAVESFANLEAEIMGLHDRAQSLALDRQTLLDKVKDFELKNKQLVEKNKRFLEKNVELTAQNRCLKDGNHTMQQQYKKGQDELEVCRQRQCELARELQRVRGHNLELEAQAQEVESVRKQIADQTSTITLLRQACTDKDRRIELIQHRKKRRRLIRSQEKCQGVKETFYGYDEDDNDASIDSETSLSSVSVSTISEEDACDELSREELERSHRQLLREHLQLERSHALLQAHTGASQDPYRELQTRSQLQADLFSAQCRVELLEKEVRSLQSSKRRRGTEASCDIDVEAVLREREELLAATRGLQMKLEEVDAECTQLRQQLREAEEKVEDLEFRILELEENPPADEQPDHHDLCERDHQPLQSCSLDKEDQDDKNHLENVESCGITFQAAAAECLIQAVAPAPLECLPILTSPKPAESPAPEKDVSMEFERLRRELKTALEGHGVKKVDAILKGLGGLQDVEQKVRSMEQMAMEMQKKVIGLQQERDGLEERLMRGAPLSLNAEVERRQNLELKEQITRLAHTEEECRSENLHLRKQLEESEHLCVSLQEQLKEFLEPVGHLELCSSSLIGGSKQNKTDMEKAGEEDLDGRKCKAYEEKSTQTDKTAENKGRSKKSRSRSREKERAEIQALTLKVNSLQEQLKKLEAEKSELIEKANQPSNDSSSDEDDPLQPSLKHTPKHKVKTLERQLQVLHSENIRLADKLGGYAPNSRLDPDEVIERIVELEDFCTELQDRVQEAEGHERQVREKLRLAEQTINELETSEAQYRDKSDELSQLERETKKQLHSLQTTGRELREIILDKDIMEQALKEKVEFLEKVEEQSSHRISELESIEKSLREQLEAYDKAGGTDQQNRTLKEKLAAAEQEIRTLTDNNRQLEENEEILRENWRRVADEDANRLQCLEEKVRMLDLTNQDLKNKLAEAQDFVVINSGPAQGSLADELSASSRRGQAKPHSDSPVSGDSDEESGDESPKKMVKKLKRQLSFLEEQKNGKIAGLQERLADMRENEIKLSETLAEMEMTERELKAKLALYESSEVTVEKMLKYQDKIHELRTSQESLLDQLETMESQEESLQERLEETERRLKGKIVTLEVEMKNLKQKELKGNARIRELEKHEEELTEKTKKQEDKENGLYVRISGLMDQVKEHKTRVSELEKKLAEKEERCRKVASLETKFLEIEGAYREKVTTLESSLAEAQSSMLEQQKQHEESLTSTDNEHKQRVFILEEMFAQKEKGLNEKIDSLEHSLAERDKVISHCEMELGNKDEQVAELRRDLSERDLKITELDADITSRHSEGTEMERTLSLKDERISELEKDLCERDACVDKLEKDVSEKESHIAELDKEICDRQDQLHTLEQDVQEKERVITTLESDLSEQQSRVSELEAELRSTESRLEQAEKDLEENGQLRTSLSEKDNEISRLQLELGNQESSVKLLEDELGRKESHIGELEQDLVRKTSQVYELEKELSDRVSQVHLQERDIITKGTRVLEMEKDLIDKTSFINQLETAVSDRDSRLCQLETELVDRESQIGDLEAQLEAKEDETSRRLEKASHDVMSKDSHIAQMEERIIQMSSTIAELNTEAAEKVSDLEKQLSAKDTVVAEHVSQLQTELESNQKSSADRVSSLEGELEKTRSELSLTVAKSEESFKKVAEVESELEKEKSNVATLRKNMEDELAERDSHLSQLNTKISDLEDQLKEQDDNFKTQMSVRESEFHRACASLDAECESLRREIAEKNAVIEKLESNKNELLSKIENLKDREKDLVTQLSAAKRDFHNQHMQKEEDMQAEVTALESRLKNAECEKEVVEEKLSSAEADLASSRQTITQQLEEISRLETNLKEAKSEAEVLQETLSKLQQQEVDSAAQAQALLQQEVMLKSRVSQVEAQLETTSKSQEQQKASVSELQAQKLNLEEALAKVQRDLSDSHSLNGYLQDNVSQLSMQTKTLQKEVTDLATELKEYQKQEQEIQELLEREKGHVQDLEFQISSLKDEKQSALAEAAKINKSLALAQEKVQELEAQISRMTEVEESLRTQIQTEQNARLEADHRLGQMDDEVKVAQENLAKMRKDDTDKDAEMDKLKADLLLQKHELQAQQLEATMTGKKEQELQTLQQEQKAWQDREALLQDKVVSLESQMGRHQEDHSQLCLKLQQLEKREKELLEQITDIEQTVIVPLEGENSELKEEVAAIKQQNEDLNLQVDKLEDRAREDLEELEVLQKAVTNVQFARTEVQSKLDIVERDLNQQESENEMLQSKIVDLEALNKRLEEQLHSKQVDLDAIELTLDKELCCRDVQTDWDIQAVEAERSALEQKLTVFQDAESKFMSRILDLEQREQQLCDELASVRRSQEQVFQSDRHTQTEEAHLQSQVSLASVDASVNTEPPLEPHMTKVPQLFARVQELESANQQLSVSLEQASSGERDRQQLLEKLHLLEQAEDRLMERVMELEENEVTMRTQIERSRHRAKVADELEEEVSVLLQQEDEWKEKVASLSSQNASLSQKVESLQSHIDSEQSRNEDLVHQVETEQRKLQDAQKELKLVQTKLQAVRSEYEEKLSALEESEKKIENQLHSQSHRESDLQQEVQVLREEIEDVCERYKELELENSRLKQQHSKVLVDLKDAESRCLMQAGEGAREPTMQAAQVQSLQSRVPLGANVSLPTGSDSEQPLSPPPVMCSNVSVQMVQSSQVGAQGPKTSLSEESLLARISQLESELSEAHRVAQSGGRALHSVHGSEDSSGSEVNVQERGDSDSSGVHSASIQPVKILTLHDALAENAALKAQVQELQSGYQSAASSASGDDRGRRDSVGKQSADTLQLQAEISRLQSYVSELEKDLKEAEGAVQEVVTVVRTRSVHTLEQKIETIQQTIHTQSPAWSLHQELLELLTSQADLQKQVSHLMETEHNLRSALKQAEDELSRLRSDTGATAFGVRRLDTDRRLSFQSRLSRFGGGVHPPKPSGETGNTQVDSSKKAKEQWLERQVADLQLAKSNLERRLHEAERRLAFRPRPTSASRDELLFRIDQLQEEQGEWRKKVEDLEALNSHYLKEKLELASERDSLEQRLQEKSPGARKEVNPVFLGGTRQEPLGRSGSVSEDIETSADADAAMLEKPEDVLHKRIKELENLESYLRQQLNEVESDRDQLHEIARKDKATIHEQNVRLRELMLQERNLRSQVSTLEDSERTLYNRCGELQDDKTRMEDRVHELEVHERRLRELVRKLKLDEEVWLSKSGDLTASMEQLSSSEVSLRKMVQDLQIEKGGLFDRAEYLETRVKELEALETTLVQRLKNYENVESSLQSRLQHTENSEAAAHSKASELDVINLDLSARLQRAVEENAVLSQHVAQQQGQIHEMDRKLSAAMDAQVGLNQHVESLQKNEGALQKKVREYELRDIDAQARVRELEQTEEILKDKVNQLQRSENRLKSRLVEFETVGSQMLDNMPPAQKQQLPQKLEDCQKRIVVLQRQLEAAQADVQRLQLPQEDATSVKVPTAALIELRSKVALLEETEYQMSELEKLNAQLTENILQLRQGKGSSGHEVELEVLKRRLHSYQNCIQNLKHHLSEGQVPSLRAADSGQGPETEDLPARSLQWLESERVLHSVRSLTQPPGLPHTEEELVQVHSGTLQAGKAQGVAAAPSEPEESHWRLVEARRRSQQEAELRGTSTSLPGASSTFTAPPRQEELMIGLSLPSESERSSFKSQNDTDSEKSGPVYPHLRMVGSTQSGLASAPGVVPSPRGSGRAEAQTPPMPATTSNTKATWPPTAPNAQQQRLSAGFVTDDSFYLPSSAQSESESQDDGEAPPLPSSAPPGTSLSAPPSIPQPSSKAPPSTEKTFVSAVTLPGLGQKSGKGEGVAGDGGEGAAGLKGRSQTMPLQPSLQTTSAVGLSIRQRIAQIERQLKENPSPKAGSKAEDEDVFTWKTKATENARLLGSAERESKQLKEDLPPAARRREKINKLEKDLEEKRRYIYIFEKWILDAEEVLKNKNKKNDRDLVQQLQTEVKHLKQDLGNAGYRKDDIFTDPAALKTELDRKDRELYAKRAELDSVAEEMQHWRLECNNVEMMRRNALDSLRLLETEVTQLQDADIQLKQMKDEYNTLRGQYDEVDMQKNKAMAAVHTLRAKVARLAKKCQEKDELVRRLAEELRGGRGRSSSLLEELTRLETLAGGEEYNRPMSPLDLITGSSTSETERLLSERIPRWPSSSSLGDPLDHIGTSDLLRGTDRSSLRRPKSAEQVRSQPVSGIGSSHGYGGESLCVAVLDYQPDAASRSGHRHLELPLKEGDHVRIRGPVDRHGYCEAEVGGRTGLVPAGHLYPLTDAAAVHRPTSQPSVSRRKAQGDSVDQIVQMFDELQDPRLVSRPVHGHSTHISQNAAHSAATQTRQRRSFAKNQAAPGAPTSLHIKEVEGNSLVLAWLPPVLDQHGCNNGVKVVGYRIYLNGRVCQQPHNPRLSQTRVEGLRHDRPQQLAIQTLAASGQLSARVELVYQGGTPTSSHKQGGEDGEADTDLSSILNSIQYKTGKKRTVMGLYDYDPEKQSPGDYTTLELAFHAGDIMYVYGEERQDGFFHGERNGQRGLVPACFVEVVTQSSKSSQKPSAANGSSSPRS